MLHLSSRKACSDKPSQLSSPNFGYSPARADDTLKASLKGKRKYAGWDDAFMATLMAG